MTDNSWGIHFDGRVPHMRRHNMWFHNLADNEDMDGNGVIHIEFYINENWKTGSDRGRPQHCPCAAPPHPRR